MGWFWNSSDDDDKPNGKGDTFSHLSPEARAFLENEAPLKPSRHLPAPTPEAAEQQNKDFDPTVYSKYDKKYADIWASYKPKEMVDQEYRTPQVAVHEVYKSYKDRQGMVARAALENCVFEQEALHNCYASSKVASLTGCSKQSKESEGCYRAQQKFLKSLGYMSDSQRAPEIDEEIQMHADKLYREQVRKEKAIEANAEAGLPLDTPRPMGDE